jgi:hypothetical protein
VQSGDLRSVVVERSRNGVVWGIDFGRSYGECWPTAWNANLTEELRSRDGQVRVDGMREARNGTTHVTVPLTIQCARLRTEGVSPVNQVLAQVVKDSAWEDSVRLQLVSR